MKPVNKHEIRSYIRDLIGKNKSEDEIVSEITKMFGLSPYEAHQEYVHVTKYESVKRYESIKDILLKYASGKIDIDETVDIIMSEQFGNQDEYPQNFATKYGHKTDAYMNSEEVPDIDNSSVTPGEFHKWLSKMLKGRKSGGLRKTEDVNDTNYDSMWNNLTPSEKKAMIVGVLMKKKELAKGAEPNTVASKYSQYSWNGIPQDIRKEIVGESEENEDAYQSPFELPGGYDNPEDYGAETPGEEGAARALDNNSGDLKVGDYVNTPDGSGVIRYMDSETDKVIVELSDGTKKAYDRSVVG
jgi:hypothetical protein